MRWSLPGTRSTSSACGARATRPTSGWRACASVACRSTAAFSGFAGHMAEYLGFAGIAAVRLAASTGGAGTASSRWRPLPDFLAFAAAPLKLTGVPLLLDLHEDMPDSSATASRIRCCGRCCPPCRRRRRHRPGCGRAHHGPRAAARSFRSPAACRRTGSRRHEHADTDLFDAARHPRRPFMQDGELRLIHHSNLQRSTGSTWRSRQSPGSTRWLAAALDVYGDGPFRPAGRAGVARTGTARSGPPAWSGPARRLAGLLAASDIGLVPPPEPYLQYSLARSCWSTRPWACQSSPATWPRSAPTSTTRPFACPGRRPCRPGGRHPAARRTPELTAHMAAEAQRQLAPYDWARQASRYLRSSSG